MQLALGVQVMAATDSQYESLQRFFASTLPPGSMSNAPPRAVAQLTAHPGQLRGLGTAH